MCESGIFTPANVELDTSSGFVMPEVLATTSLSVLYRVRKAGKYFIIKTPRNCSGQSLALLQREYELSLGKSHPNIVNVYTYESSTVVGPGIVMEYIDGRNLSEFIAENPTVAARRRVLLQLLQAVSYIHRNGLVHNDIKPENIIISRSDNDVKLIDFGLADSDAYYLARTLGCTGAYASPELLARENDIDSRSDIYSLGLIIKELFGKRYSRVVNRCLYKEKQKRYNNADELLSAVRHYNRPLVVSLSLVAAFILLLPLLYIGNTVATQNENVIKEKELFMQIEQTVDSLYSLTADSLSHAVYFEFASNNIVNFFESLAEYNQEYISTITPSDMYTKASVHYARSVAGYNERLWNMAYAMPSYLKSGLSVDEVQYYNKLIEKRLPYTPYRKE